jgi:(E)-4-hydroxy-3-methylbut-2-enyl-diphosphate synthase
MGLRSAPSEAWRVTQPYTNDLFLPGRRPTRVVHVGDVPVGGDQPIRVQSMTTTYTHDVEGTLGQIERLVAAGCEIVRVTVPTMKDAQALPAIREGMQARGLSVPLVADIHFSPKLAMLAVEHVDKIRVNPGNFTDGQKFFKETEYTDESYAAELAKVEAKLTPLVLRAKERGISMRVGTNHGSLSDRIVNRFGDSPAGMVESALEFLRICRKLDYHDLIISMKASNTRVMIEAYRLLVAKMDEEGMDYPFHLGVTEAGDGDDARIKSAIGIGSLLQDGIGDTIRVSLTEDPAAEVPVGFAIGGRGGPALTIPACGERADLALTTVQPYEFRRRPARRVEQGSAHAAVGADQDLRVEVDLGRASARPQEALSEEALRLAGEASGDRRLEVAVLDVQDAADVEALEGLRARLAREPQLSLSLSARAARAVWTDPALRERTLTAADRLEPCELAQGEVAELAQAVAAHEDTALLLWATLTAPVRDVAGRLVEQAQAAVDAGLEHVLVSLRPHADLVPAAALRVLVALLDARGLDLPLVLSAPFRGEHALTDAATSAGGLLTDGIGDALRLEGDAGDAARRLDLAYAILQGARRRTTQTEYISCPGCGRTLFELEPVTAQIKQRTSHLKGVKIAVMGCVVNGPGEMADADFGYVGWKPGKVNLYVGKECVVRDVPEDEAPDRLVQLIRDQGRWTEAPQALPIAGA